MSRLIETDPWQVLRRFTPARIALGRAGDSAPTEALLDFGLAHAQARDAVHVPMDCTAIVRQLADAGYASIAVHSAASDRNEYLRRPDLGRRLNEAGRARLRAHTAAARPPLVFVMGDGLSAAAAMRHAVPLLQSLGPRLTGWVMAPIVVASQARVALGDEIGELLGAEQVVVLIGERPGLSCADGLGIYLTYAPRVGRTDAERNCISNVRPEGLGYEQAAHRLAFLLAGARRLGRSGVRLKDESEQVRPGSKLTSPAP
ncbi:MAG: ethanolamine ammonia-lyase subunit EutC [Steroidobacterales bacterium]